MKSDKIGSNPAKDALAKTADMAFDKRMLRSPVRIELLCLQHAYYAFCEAAWAQPMRGLTFCCGLLERIERKAVGNSSKPIALKIRIVFLCARKFFLNLAFFFAKLRYRALRRRQLVDELAAFIRLRGSLCRLIRKLCKHVRNGRPKLRRLAECRQALGYLDGCLARFYGCSRGSCDLDRCHGAHYTKKHDSAFAIREAKRN